MIYVDNSIILYKGKLRCHMTADTKEELHAFAETIGVKRCWFHKAKTQPHYDITEIQRAKAIAGGAVGVSNRVVLEIAKKLTKL